MAGATDSDHAPFIPSLPFQLPLGPVLLVIQGTAIDLNLARGTPRAVPQLSSGYGITPSSSTPSWPGGKTMILATSTVTTTTATTIATCRRRHRAPAFLPKAPEDARVERCRKLGHRPDRASKFHICCAAPES
ncbi:hypothetical protein LSCM4_07646 [Leishmania orientalis]|uniref:Uncharacterized protein n=1 Tax=Leishmania orientalis TaxID=2249476 RepID=A0A836H311_9TRYP|nr:hypothetical protein LSCM4_07646 [Leishmania orientalis]